MKKNKDLIIGSISLLVIVLVVMFFAKPLKTKPTAPVACTMDAKQCFDGSYVGRIPPLCEFAECPTPKEIQKKSVVSKNITVKYTTHGFDPEKITINAGSQVDFLNTSNTDFWPIFDDFEVNAKIAPGNKFMHIFKEAGIFKYKNKLNEKDTGTIVVK